MTLFAISSLDTQLPTRRGLDLVDSIHGLYRLIDLITEQGSGGLGESASGS